MKEPTLSKVFLTLSRPEVHLQKEPMPSKAPPLLLYTEHADKVRQRNVSFFILRLVA